MKKLTIYSLIFFCFSLSAISQSKSNVISENSVDKHFYFGIGGSYGFFYPGDVNDYIATKMAYYSITEGVTDMFLNFVGRVYLTYRINKNIDLSAVGEVAWAPKFIYISDGYDEYFHFNRLSPGIMAKFYFPIASGKNSIYFAPGLFYHSMKFEEFKGSNIGAKAQAGFSFNFSKFSLQPFLCYDYAKAYDDSYNYEFELNYSGIQFGVDFLF